MSDYSTRDAVQFAIDGEATKFKSAVDSILMQKVADTLDLERINMAQSMFASDDLEDEVEAEADTDEPVENEGTEEDEEV